MGVLTKLVAAAVCLTVFSSDMKPVEAAMVKPVEIESGYSDMVNVRSRRYRRGRNYRGARNYRRSRNFRRGRNYRRYRRRAVGIGIGIGIGSAVVGGAFNNYYSGRRYYNGRRYNRSRRYYDRPVVYERPRRARRVYSNGGGDAHVGWCARRYRSYRISDNTFQPYNGGRRSCTSPYN